MTRLTVIIHDHQRPRMDTPSNFRSLRGTVPAYLRAGSEFTAARTRRNSEMYCYSMEFDRSIDPRPPEAKREEERWALTTIWRS